MNTREFINKVIEASETGLNDIYATVSDTEGLLYYEVTGVRRDDNGNVAIELTE